MVINPTNWSHNDQYVLGRMTFPTKRETAENYPVHFSDGQSFWRVFNADVPQAAIDKVVAFWQKKYGADRSKHV